MFSLRGWSASLIVLISAVAAAAPVKKAAPKAPAKTAPVKPEPPPPPAVPTEPMAKMSEAVGQKVVTALTQAASVTAWRVSSTGLRPDPARAIGSDFQREGAGVPLNADQLKTLRGILYADSTYRFDADVSKCNFVPSVSFSVQSGLDTVEVMLSYSCSQVLFFIGKPGGRWLPGGTFDIKPARDQFMLLTKKALP